MLKQGFYYPIGSIGEACDPKAASTAGCGVRLPANQAFFRSKNFGPVAGFFGRSGKRLGTMTFLAPSVGVAS
jgi:hypothetical protein